MVAFYVFLQFGCIDGRLLGRPFRLKGFTAGLALRLAGLLRRGLGGIPGIQFRPAGIPPGDAQSPLQFALAHISRGVRGGLDLRRDSEAVGGGGRRQ